VTTHTIYDEQGKLVSFKPEPHFEWKQFRASYSRDIALWRPEITRIVQAFLAHIVSKQQQESQA
jgi:hypothetical protein